MKPPRERSTLDGAAGAAARALACRYLAAAERRACRVLGEMRSDLAPLPVAFVVIQSGYPGDGPAWPSGCRVARLGGLTRR